MVFNPEMLARGRVRKEQGLAIPRPYPIANFRQAMRLDVKPWLLPQDAFEESLDWMVRDGQLCKRSGYTFFGDLGDEAATLTAGAGLTTLVGSTGDTTVTSAEYGALATPVVAGSIPTAPWPATNYNVRFTVPGNNDVIDDPSSYNAGTLAWDLIDATTGLKVGEIRYSDGFYDFTVPIAPVGDVTVTYNVNPAHPTVGVFSFRQLDGTERLLAANTRRLYEYQTTQKVFQEVTAGADVWSGDSEDVMQFVPLPVADTCLLLNGNDAPQIYDPSIALPLSRVNAAGFGAHGVSIAMAKLGVYLHGHLVYFNMVEGAVSFPQRARWSEVNQPESFRTQDVADADVQGEIVSIWAFENDILCLFADGPPWVFHYSGDPRAPFEWRQFKGSFGSVSRLSPIDFRDKVALRGRSNIVESDGFRMEELDAAIPDFVNSAMQPDAAAKTVGARHDDCRGVLWSYVRRGQSEVDRALMYQWEDEAWSTHTLPFISMGTWTTKENLLWDDFTNSWDSESRTFDDGSIVAGFPVLLGGTLNGQVYQLFNGTLNDDAHANDSVPVTSPLAQRAEKGILGLLASKQWNPYGETQRARLHWIDVRVSQNASLRYLFIFYGDGEPIPYFTDLSVGQGLTGVGEGAWFRVFLNQTAFNHQLKVYDLTTGGAPPSIDALVPYFSPAGSPRQMGMA